MGTILAIARRLFFDCYETFRFSTKERALSINDCRNFGRICQEISVAFSAIVAVAVFFLVLKEISRKASGLLQQIQQ